ncbi:hypothetical protein [Kitasatospora sp. NPDC101183]|uniref:hypothetical protein n=1 Tax=Kitasatospora sp. NPDC101183 TaxID=3364100 RepID=UPI0038164F91
MRKQTAPAPPYGTSGSSSAPIPNFIKDGTFRKPQATANGYLAIGGPDTDLMGAWEVKAGKLVVVYSPGYTQTSHQAVDIGGAGLEQAFEVPVDANVEITWMHSRNTDPTCPGETNQAYGADVRDAADNRVLASHHYEPDGADFVQISPELTLKFTANRSSSYILTFTGRAPKACGALIYNVVGRGASGR